jgi:hypothetical protein
MLAKAADKPRKPSRRVLYTAQIIGRDMVKARYP